MIAPQSGYGPGQREQASLEGLLALLSRSGEARVARWDCEVCGMIHLGHEPMVCESCGSELLSPHSEVHREMNGHW